MLGIFLTILGIIGRILLIILLVILIILAVILFVPVRYRGYAVKTDSFRFNLQAGWLFRLLYASVRFSSSDGNGLRVRVRLAGHTLYDNKNGHNKNGHNKRKKHDRKAGDNSRDRQNAYSDSGQYDTDGSRYTAANDEAEETQNNAKNAESAMPGGDRAGTPSSEKLYIEDKHPDGHSDEGTLTENSTEKSSDGTDSGHEDAKGKKAGRIRKIVRAVINKIKQIPDKIEAVVDRIQDMPENIWDRAAAICDRLSRLDDKKERFIAFTEKEENRVWIDRSLVRIRKLLIYLFPDFDRLYIHFGFSDPSLTGKVMGALSILYPLCMESLELTPEFDENVMEGEAKFHGRVRVIMLLIYILPVVLNKRFFRIVKMVRK